MALPDTLNPSQSHFSGAPGDRGAPLSHPATNSHSHSQPPATGFHTNSNHFNQHNNDPDNAAPPHGSFPNGYDGANLYEYERKNSYHNQQIDEDRDYALALAHAALSAEIPVATGSLPHSIVLSSKLAKARSAQRAYILIPPLLNAVMLGGALRSLNLFICLIFHVMI